MATEIIRVREIGLPPMSDRDYKIYCKRREYIQKGDTEGLEKFDAKLAAKTKVEQTNVEENK